MSAEMKSECEQEGLGRSNGRWVWLYLEHHRNEKILNEAGKGGTDCDGYLRRRLEWFGHVKQRQQTENNQSSCHDEDVQRKTRPEMGRQCQKGHGRSERNGSLTQ